jgi:hypothetical protein
MIKPAWCTFHSIYCESRALRVPSITQEVLHKRHSVYCVHIMSVGCATIAVDTWTGGHDEAISCNFTNAPNKPIGQWDVIGKFGKEYVLRCLFKFWKFTSYYERLFSVAIKEVRCSVRVLSGTPYSVVPVKCIVIYLNQLGYCFCFWGIYPSNLCPEWGQPLPHVLSVFTAAPASYSEQYPLFRSSFSRFFTRSITASRM